MLLIYYPINQKFWYKILYCTTKTENVLYGFLIFYGSNSS